MAEVVASVHGCARCGGGHVNKIEWRRLERPVVDGDGTTWTHWCPCPTNGEPILMRFGSTQVECTATLEVKGDE